MSIDVDEGVAFSVGAAEWVGNKTISTSALSAALATKIGKIGERADMDRLTDGLKSARDLFLQNGCLDVGFSPTLRLDRTARIVTYHVEISEGEQYAMGALTTERLSDPAAAHIIKAWPLKNGAPFDLLAARGFPTKATQGGLVPAGLTLQVQMTPSAETHVVDVKIIATPKPGRSPIS